MINFLSKKRDIVKKPKKLLNPQISTTKPASQRTI